MDKKQINMIIAGLLCVSCSQLLLEPAAPESPVLQEDRPLTKTGSSSPQTDYTSARHFFQTDHRIILMNHVELRDSAYVQTLTEEDMRNLHITESERAFCEGYVVQLNELLKEK